ncbi:UDP-N-acetylglucosamine 1-carboxyvinyltransferase [Candidatus Gracilibacteria bacterium]|nr:UDP-N-acetylglucosamine 1-carboxyvinyltransferase [Candidatus Gracilibacteria bacterium]
MYHIKQSRDLKGSVIIGGSKNAGLPLIAAALLIKGNVILHNVPDIADTHDFLHFYKSLGAAYNFTNNTLHLDTRNISLKNIDTSKISRTRAGIYFMAGLLSRFGEAKLPFPTGDKIGKRPIDEHINGYIAMGYKMQESSQELIFSGKGKSEDVTITAYFAVTATANLIMGAATRDGITRIELSAFAPHIFNLIDFLRKAGIDIDIRYDHTIIVHGTQELQTELECEVISDYLQSGTFAIIAALCAKEYIDIHKARIEDLGAFLYKLHEAGVQTVNLGNDTLRVYRAKTLKAVDIQTNIFPGFPTDLMPLFTVLMTQCEGTSRIHEILYEGRLNWLIEYERLNCSPRIINLHEAKIEGSNKLIGGTVNSWDLRSGAAMVIAGLIAEGETRIENIYWIHRGYDNFLGKLQGLGAQIEEV